MLLGYPLQVTSYNDDRNINKNNNTSYTQLFDVCILTVKKGAHFTTDKWCLLIYSYLSVLTSQFFFFFVCFDFVSFYSLSFFTCSK